jgi:hypothetical protein
MSLSPEIIARNHQYRWANRAFAIFCGLYIVLAAIYGIQGLFTQTGVPGLLIQAQFKVFGSAGMKFTAMLVMLVYAIPLVAIQIAFRSFVPERVPDIKVIEGDPNHPDANLPWKRIWLFSAVTLGLGLLAAGGTYAWTKYDEQQPVHIVDLDKPGLELPQKARYMEITGHWAPDHLVSYRQDRTVHVLVPVTQAGWTPGVPIRVAIHGTVESPEGVRAPMPSVFNDARPFQFQAVVTAVPDKIVLEGLAAKGVKLDPDFIVLEKFNLPNGKVPASDAPVFMFFAAFALGLLVMSIMAFARLVAFAQYRRY